MLKVCRIIAKFIFFLYFLSKYRNTKIAFYLAHRRFPMELSQYVQRKGSLLHFSKTGNNVPMIHLERLMVLYPEFISLLEHPKSKVILSNNDFFRLDFDGIQIDIRSYSNLGIAYELFIEKLYDFDFSKSHYVVLDVGMNVGIASLLFASQSKVDFVYSYEPFPNTFKEAQSNIALNGAYAAKIVPNNAGVSDKADYLTVPNVESGDASGSVTSFMLNAESKSNDTIQVAVKDFVEEIEKLQLRHPQSPFFLKIDCEGEEYNIIPHLVTSSVVDKVDGMVIEWHKKGAAVLIEALNQKGFLTLSKPHLLANCGLIYAYKVPL